MRTEFRRSRRVGEETGCWQYHSSWPQGKAGKVALHDGQRGGNRPVPTRWRRPAGRRPPWQAVLDLN